VQLPNAWSDYSSSYGNVWNNYLSPTIGLNCWLGYHHSIPVYGIATFRKVVWRMLENGSWRPRNLRDGVDSAGMVKGIRQFSFAMEIQVLRRHLLGKKDYSRGREVNPC